MTQEKSESTSFTPIEVLPLELIAIMSSYLDRTNESQQAKSQRKIWVPFFRADLIQKNRILAKLAHYAFEGNISRVASLAIIRPDLRIPVLFALAGLGAQDEMENLLKEYPEDLLVKAPLRDISGAQFESISLFQHCIWTKDIRYMANMMLDCLPKNQQGEQIRLELVRQYEELMAKGVVYQLKGVMHNEHHFSLQPLITAFSTYVENYPVYTKDQKKLNWCAVVGPLQALVPAHIRHHYCDRDDVFWHRPDFQKLKLKRSLGIYNFVLHKFQLWTESLNGLGLDFGIYAEAAKGSPCCAGDGREMSGRLRGNLMNLIGLDTMRTETDLPNLIARLQALLVDLDSQMAP